MVIMNNFYVITVIFSVWITIFSYIYLLRKRDPNIHNQSILRFIFLLCLTIGFIFICNNKIGTMPPLGKFLDPFHGYLALVGSDELPKKPLVLDGLKNEVTIIWDERRIPHIFSQNDHDLYFSQGYIHAFDRLWQLEFQVLAAGGRLSEILGSKYIVYDKFQRKIGMRYGAEKALEVYLNDPEMKMILTAYTNGINTYINSLKKDQIPLEYKILDYSPEEWSLMKTALLYMYMAWTLTGNSDDLYHTRILNEFGLDIFEELYPIYPEELDPIIPSSKKWTFAPLKVNPPQKLHISDNTIDRLQFKPNPNNGSNNWAISGERSKSGKPILANDPHLNLTLPSIWYEMHLVSPNVNVYGVSLLGAAGIVIGFNNDIAWGETNGQYDVMDFYDIWFKDSTFSEYWYDESWHPTKKRIEIIKIRGDKTIQDTIIFTHHGPVVWNKKHQKSNIIGNSIPIGRAMKWLAHNPSLEAKAFYELNRATNYDEFLKAIEYFSCPGQNFVFASNTGDIAIWQATEIPVKWKNQGQFILDGSRPSNDWQLYAPSFHRPNVLNPERGFVSSANQNPVTEDYPYYYPGGYALPFRGARINNRLNQLTNADYNDLQQIQLDNTNLYAKRMLNEVIPILEIIELDDIEYEIFTKLVDWDFTYDGKSIQPTIFSRFSNILEELTWKDEFGNDGEEMIWPSQLALSRMVINEKDADWFDDINTSDIENFPLLCKISFQRTVKELVKELGELNESWEWHNYRGTDIQHLARIPGFGRLNLKTSGGSFIPNATKKTHGPSWRYIVELGDKPQGYGIYPGGQSGYPGSKHYDEFVDDWVNGKLFPLQFSKKINEINGEKVIFTPK